MQGFTAKQYIHIHVQLVPTLYITCSWKGGASRTVVSRASTHSQVSAEASFLLHSYMYMHNRQLAQSCSTHVVKNCELHVYIYGRAPMGTYLGTLWYVGQWTFYPVRGVFVEAHCVKKF